LLTVNKIISLFCSVRRTLVIYNIRSRRYFLLICR